MVQRKGDKGNKNKRRSKQGKGKEVHWEWI